MMAPRLSHAPVPGAKGGAVDAGLHWEKFYKDRRKALVPVYPAEPVVRFVARRLRAAAGPERSLVLDLGCGGGRHLELLGDFGLTGVGVDFAWPSLLSCRRRSVRRARRRFLPLARASYTQLPFHSNRFDGVIAHALLCYGYPSEIEAGVEEVRRVLKPGGWAYLWFRSTEDGRYGDGREVAPDCFRLSGDGTNERNMPVAFFDRRSLNKLVGRFRDAQVEYSKVISASGRIDADWHVEVRT